MSFYCDTSFFVRQLIPSPFRMQALDLAEQIEKQQGHLGITSFTRLEVIQSLRFQAWLNQNDRSTGYPATLVDSAVNLFLAQIGPVSRLIAVNWQDVFARTEALSRSTPSKGWRTLDIIHVACALSLNASTFISFDQNQNLLARAEGLQTPLMVPQSPAN